MQPQLLLAASISTVMSLVGPNVLVEMEDVVWVVSTFERSELGQLAGLVRAAHAGLAFVAWHVDIDANGERFECGAVPARRRNALVIFCMVSPGR
jgi:hypothetical protein